MSHDWQLNIVCHRPLANYLDRNATFCKDHVRQCGGRGWVFWKQASGKNLAGIWEAQSRRLMLRSVRCNKDAVLLCECLLVLCIFTTEWKKARATPEQQLQSEFKLLLNTVGRQIRSHPQPLELDQTPRSYQCQRFGPWLWCVQVTPTFSCAHTHPCEILQ